MCYCATGLLTVMLMMGCRGDKDVVQSPPNPTDQNNATPTPNENSSNSDSESQNVDASSADDTTETPKLDLDSTMATVVCAQSSDEAGRTLETTNDRPTACHACPSPRERPPQKCRDPHLLRSLVAGVSRCRAVSVFREGGAGPVGRGLSSLLLSPRRAGPAGRA